MPDRSRGLTNARLCRVGDSSGRDSIAAAIVDGEPIRGIADRFVIGPEPLRRHVKHHPGPALAATQAAADRAKAKTTLERMEVQYEILADLVQAARVGGHSTTISNASRQLRQTAELPAKIAGEPYERPQATVTSWPHRSG